MNGEKTLKIESLNRRIVMLTLPTIVSNISVPLLGLCDTAVAGHMGDERYLAGMAIGSIMVTTMYWLFSFLRAGTSGLTASYYGSADRYGMGVCLRNSLLLAIVIGLILMAVCSPVLGFLQKVMGATPQTAELAGEYFSLCIRGAVPMMILTALSGWLIGMQSTSSAMWVNIGVSVLNVAATLMLVYGFGFGYAGIAIGTVLSQWIMIVPAACLCIRICKMNGIVLWRSINDGHRRFAATPSSPCYGENISCNRTGSMEWKAMLNVNSNLFFRSACLIALSLMLYGYSARLGDIEVGANAVINQMFLFFSYFMDGFAFTGEALVGRYSGARNLEMLGKSILLLLGWTAGLTLIFILVYSLFLSDIVHLLSDSKEVAESVAACKIWVSALPLAGAFAFIFDGFYIGLTKTRPMLISTIGGVGLFAILLHFIDHTQWMIWMAFVCYLALRSLLLISLFPYTLKKLQLQKIII
ncbi:MAG: MATE family efflux transporter [Muribaculaceae bacterium]|nr:MATE family efflux transporter [Muribaculaceae bacterium]